MGPMPRSSAATRPSRSVSSSTAAKPASPVTVVSGLPIRTLDRGCLDLRLFRRSVFTEQVPFNSIGCGSSGGTSRCLWDDVLGVAGLVDAVTFLGEVVAPVVVEVAVAGDGAQFEDGLCAG